MDGSQWFIARKGQTSGWQLEFWRPEFFYPAALGRGGVKTFCSGNVTLCRGEATLAGPAVLHASDRRRGDARLVFNLFHLVHGAFSIRPLGSRRSLELSGGHYALYAMPEDAARFDYNAGPHRLFTGGISLGLLRTLAEGMELPRSLWPVLEGGQARPFAVQAHADRRLPLLLRELEQHDYEGVTARLYQEAKGLELVAHLARVWTERKAPARWRWNRRDLERLHEARRRLSTPTETPVSLAELARSLGLSPSKLKRGFREVFGTTMSETLREARLQAARRLLLETGLPLKTIALQVGFCDAASLGNAFRKRFGVPPGALRRF